MDFTLPSLRVPVCRAHRFFVPKFQCQALFPEGAHRKQKGDENEMFVPKATENNVSMGRLASSDPNPT